jgi:hypothetical protein
MRLVILTGQILLKNLFLIKLILIHKITMKLFMQQLHQDLFIQGGYMVKEFVNFN